MLLLSNCKPCGTTRAVFLLFILISVLMNRFNCQNEIVQDEDNNEMNDLNEDESSGLYQEEEENTTPKSLELDKKQPVLTQNQLKNKNDQAQKVIDESSNIEFNDDDQKESEDDAEDDIEPDLDSQKDNDYDSFDDDSDKPVEKTQQVQPVYQSSKSKLLNIITKPGILAGIVGGAIIGVLTAILLIMFIVYRMRKKDEGSYALEETKKPLNAYDYRHCPTKEFYA